MLTGRRPFELEQGPDILARVQTESPPCPRSINAKVPRDLRAVCLKCLAKEPADRYASAAALADDLDRYLAGRPVEARPVSLGVRALRWARRRPVEAAALAFAFLVSAAAVGIAADRWVRDVESRARLKTEEAESDAAEEKARTADMTSTLASTLMSVRERRAARSAEWASTNLEELRGLAALAVGKNAVGILRNEAAAALAAIDLGTPRAIAQGFKTYALAFTPDGRELALASWFAVPEESRTCVVRIVDPATGRVVRELRYPSNAAWEFRYGKLHLDGSRSITYSPDGRWLVVGTRSQCLVRWDLHETNPKATRWLHCPETVGIGAFPMTVHVDQVAFDDRGRLLSGNEGRQVVVWDAPNDWKALSRKSGEPGLHLARPSGPALATTHPLLEPVNPWIHAVALEGTLSMERSKLVWNRHVLVDHTNGRDLFELASQEHLATDVGTVTDAVFSPDGQLLVTTAEHQGHLKLWDTLSGRLLASRKLPKGSQRTAFCPDGKSLAVATEGHVLLYGIHRPRVTDVVGFQRSLIHDANLDAAPDTPNRVPSRPGHGVLGM